MSFLWVSSFLDTAAFGLLLFGSLTGWFLLGLPLSDSSLCRKFLVFLVSLCVCMCMYSCCFFRNLKLGSGFLASVSVVGGYFLADLVASCLGLF